MRPLTVSLLAEGRSDLLFLEGVLDRQFTALSFEGDGFEFFGVLRVEVSTVSAAARVDEAVVQVSTACSLVLVHHDHNEAAKIDALRARLAASGAVHSRIVGAVPVRETEAWMLADRDALSAVRGARLGDIPGSIRELEKTPDPKAVLRSVCGCVDDELFQRLGDTVSLERLAEVPAYQSFLQDLTTALKELNFL